MRPSRLPALALALLAIGLPAHAQAPPGKVFRVGITQIVSHPVLDAQRTAFIDELKKEGFEEGKNVRYDVQVAQNDATLSKTIAEKFVADRVDLILSTPSMQAAVRATRDSGIPVVFAAVTDPVSAGVLASVDRPSGTHVTGVYNFDPVEAQMELARELRPGLKTLGVIYNAGESNSVANVKLLKTVTQKFGWSLVEATVTSTAEVRTAAQSLVGRTDAVYMPTDNTVMAGLEALLRVAQEAKLPLVTGDVSSVQRGALGAVGDDPEDKGRQAATLAVRVLRGTKPGDVKPEMVRKRLLYLNRTTARAIGITLPDGLVQRAAKVFD
jgi:putative tryptophan/tyrosine transport system substrate-binding protein